ncbi:DUF4391 domain-containing protein [Actinokineospora spheciospongiae]|uniref:DUF4391 domain-containing protein n=1 Tax=Actinokineospora spheciospongiae TaxID=909613 RepID=UPI000DA104A2|nr:DUF4391 domain-containing protein [Actinokineospora spheciospongiae]PWW60243.1 uncharacterized protein DUF4391 [Actinokineospora spheciospongiae]
MSEKTSLDPAELLGLPERARLSERLTKRLLREQVGGGTGSTPEGKFVDRVVASAQVVGILRPETILIPAYRDHGRDGTDRREVTDIAVLHLRLKQKIAPSDRRRLVELVQRAMPRLVVLFLDGPDLPGELALALTHVSRTDPEKRTSVIDASITVPVAELPDGVLDTNRRDRTNLWALYRDLVRIAATGGRPASAALGTDEAVRLHHRLTALQAELDAVTREAKRARSQQSRITLNTTAKALRQQVATVRTDLYSADPSK